MLASVPPLDSGPLVGQFVHLLPLAPEHTGPLFEAAEESRQNYDHTHVPGTLDEMKRFVEATLVSAQQGAAVPFATVDAKRGRVVGTTRFANLEHWISPVAGYRDCAPGAVEIGWTWLAHSAQRTHVNTEAKLLMLRHAFGAWKMPRVYLKTAESNARSRAAIQRLGAKLDGVMTTYLPGLKTRQTAFYSLLADEWPANEARLVARLSASR
jgi:RimJ/RimL family protein N-acetyltransferase